MKNFVQFKFEKHTHVLTDIDRNTNTKSVRTTRIHFRHCRCTCMYIYVAQNIERNLKSCNIENYRL